jgi:chorismate mutase/prephenate dehydratase
MTDAIEIIAHDEIPRGRAQGEIDDQRSRIDQIDRQIADLIKRRAEHALAIKRYKGASGETIFTPHRESEILDRLNDDNPGPLPAASLAAIFTEIISACRALQGELTVAYLGPEFSFSHQAARGRFGGSCGLAPQVSITDVFDEVAGGRCQVGLAPIENSNQGSVGATHDLLLKTRLQVCGEVFCDVSHALMANQPDLDRIEVVYSHCQALDQCQGWLRRNLPRATLEEDSSTAGAVRRAAGRPKAAAIGWEPAADRYGLRVLARGIQDFSDNCTRFLLVSETDCPPTGRDKTSIVFVAQHQPGSLYRALAALAGQGLNLTYIGSRPIKDRPWEYAFFADVIGHRLEDDLASALEAMGREVEWLKVLGSYPQERRS